MTKFVEGMNILIRVMDVVRLLLPSTSALLFALCLGIYCFPIQYSINTTESSHIVRGVILLFGHLWPAVLVAPPQHILRRHLSFHIMSTLEPSRQRHLHSLLRSVLSVPRYNRGFFGSSVNSIGFFSHRKPLCINLFEVVRNTVNRGHVYMHGLPSYDE